MGFHLAKERRSLAFHHRDLWDPCHNSQAVADPPASESAPTRYSRAFAEGVVSRSVTHKGH